MRCRRGVPWFVPISRSSAPPIRCRLTRFSGPNSAYRVGTCVLAQPKISIHQHAKRYIEKNAERTEIYTHATGSKDHRPYLRSPYNRPMASHAYYRSNAGPISAAVALTAIVAMVWVTNLWS